VARDQLVQKFSNFRPHSKRQEIVGKGEGVFVYRIELCAQYMRVRIDLTHYIVARVEGKFFD
jgi:hypothetical protein